MFTTPRSLRWAAWAALFVGIAGLASAASVPAALRGGTPFTLENPQKQFEDLAEHYGVGVLLGLVLYGKSMLGAVAIAAVAANAFRSTGPEAKPHSTRAALGGVLAVGAFLVHAARGIWFASIEPAAAVRYAGGDQATRQAMLVFLQLNLLFHHFFNWLYIFFGGLGYALLGWALWKRVRRLATTLWLAALAHAVHFPATMYNYYSIEILNRQRPLLSLWTETGVWLFPGLAFLMAALWLKQLSESSSQ